MQLVAGSESCSASCLEVLSLQHGLFLGWFSLGLADAMFSVGHLEMPAQSGVRLRPLQATVPGSEKNMPRACTDCLPDSRGTALGGLCAFSGRVCCRSISALLPTMKSKQHCSLASSFWS